MSREIKFPQKRMIRRRGYPDWVSCGVARGNQIYRSVWQDHVNPVEGRYIGGNELFGGCHQCGYQRASAYCQGVLQKCDLKVGHLPAEPLSEMIAGESSCNRS